MNVSNKNYFRVAWDDHKNNFGDILTPYIVEHFCKHKKVKRIPSFLRPYKKHYFIIGSILQKCNKNTYIWGAGLISSSSEPSSPPKAIYAVRGPKTRQILLRKGIECPEVYGDPALLLPEIYQPKKTIEKRYKIGVIPHYVDKTNNWLSQFENSEHVKVIDVQQKNPLRVIDDMLSCEKIASSSLHGIVVADAYRIPSLWISFSNKVCGDGFKFLDYYESIGQGISRPLEIKENTAIDDIVASFKAYQPVIDLEKLKAACPFSTDT